MDNIENAATDMVREIQKWRETGQPDLERIQQIQERLAFMLDIDLKQPA